MDQGSVRPCRRQDLHARGNAGAGRAARARADDHPGCPDGDTDPAAAGGDDPPDGRADARERALRQSNGLLCIGKCFN